MLRSFRLGNHRSFRDEQELLLMPVYSKDRLVLPVAAVYGANASGKSNLLDGLRFMTEAVRESFATWAPEGGVPRRPFKLDPASRDEPSIFVVELVTGGVRYTYGFEADFGQIREEWLYGYPEKRRRVLFERSGSEIRFGTTVAEGAARSELLKGLLRPNALLLSLAAQSGIDAVLPAYRWFAEDIVFRDGSRTRFDQIAVARFLQEEPLLSDKLVELLKLADLGIRGIQASVPKLTDESMDDSDVVFALTQTANRVRLTHGPQSRPFYLEEESAGTLSWLSLLPQVLVTLRRGGLLVIDEIDASLHPRLTGALVGLFRDERVNSAGAQLLFTTHDASLLSPVLGDEVLTREDVWFVEKNEKGASELYALTDFKPRKEGENFERRYLGGSYGGVPDVHAETLVSALLRGIDGAS